MNRKNTSPQQPPELLLTHKEAKTKIEDRIVKGNNLLATQLASEDEFEKFKLDHAKWHTFNSDLLSRIFSTSSIKNEYNAQPGGAYSMNQGWTYWANEEKVEIKRELSKLESIIERLELIPSRVTTSNISHHDTSRISNKKVFIVHGHDEEAKQTLARFLTKLKLTPVILHEQANEGNTVIEKFEQHSDVDFAVVLLTPDDSGFSKKTPNEVRNRARQNVIFELGYFMGKRGRKHVCALLKESVEIPSDYQGILYIPFDDGEAWQLKLAKEMKSSGLEIDFNDL